MLTHNFMKLLSLKLWLAAYNPGGWALNFVGGVPEEKEHQGRCTTPFLLAWPGMLLLCSPPLMFCKVLGLIIVVLDYPLIVLSTEDLHSALCGAPGHHPPKNRTGPNDYQYHSEAL